LASRRTSGPFEYIATYVALRGYGPTALVGRKSGLPATDAFLRESREACGVETIYSKNGVREMLRILRNGRSIGFVLDQNMRRGVGIFVNFFGIAASTTPALALIAARRNTPVVPTFVIRLKVAKGGTKSSTCQRCRSRAAATASEDILINTRRFTLVLEAIIRRYPEQWFWVHRRWRCRPATEPPKSRPQPVPEPEPTTFRTTSRLRRARARPPPSRSFYQAASKVDPAWPAAGLRRT
jgi:KDO2-lipid IV(A) lauroyltransferase